MATSTPSMTFAGIVGEDVPLFLQNIQQEAFKQGRQREDGWIADYALTMLRGRALIWYYDLEEDVQSSWRKLRVAIIDRFGIPDTAAGPSAIVPMVAVTPTTESIPAPELMSPPPEYSRKDPLAPEVPPRPDPPAPRPEQVRPSLTITRHTQSMSNPRPHSTAPAPVYAQLARSETTIPVARPRPSTSYTPAFHSSVVPEPITPLIPARRGYIKLVASQIGSQLAVGWIGAGKNWYDIKKERSKAMYIEVPPFWTTHQAPWEMKIINSASRVQEQGLILHLRGPDNGASNVTWSFIKDPNYPRSRYYMVWRNCWVINGTPGEEEFSIMWKYRDGKEDILTILEKRGMFSSNGLMLRSQNYKAAKNEIPLRMIFDEVASDR
ncbi:hypothetical protein FRB95_009357 [Tulasnella sp. JGI-2019a]|nr:hypothetical protein FRB95_009357 [Tulasnella sp. JGI-2019a]